MPAARRERARGTWVLFGVQIIAACGFGASEARRAEMEGKWRVWREEAVEGPSVRWSVIVFGKRVRGRGG